MSWITPVPGGCVLTVKACPRANRTEVSGIDAEWVRVRIQAPPVDGKANAELVHFFARQFDLPKRAVEILSGDTGRLKRIKLCGVTAEQCKAVLSRDHGHTG
ncbi:MAG: DUF167 domain-containing protein [Kiritimatiellaeota bacterium]|nr:DUF167 domain-containing protein [Kiritimatiellota bacterium]